MKYIRVQIIGDHPHSGKTGYLQITDDECVDVVKFQNATMVKIELDEGDGCYSQAKNLRKLSRIRNTRMS